MILGITQLDEMNFIIISNLKVLAELLFVLFYMATKEIGI
jgi:hypothetical protein